jgi:hypothetical protein
MMAMTREDQAMIDAFMAKRAPRRFEQGDTAEDWNLLRYVERHGHKAFRNLGATMALLTYSIDDKVLSRAQFLALVNQMRAEDGKPPIGSLT